MRVFRRTVLAALPSVALLFFAPSLATSARAQNAMADAVAKPVSLPDIAIGSPKAPVTITEYASMSCPHCAAFVPERFRLVMAKDSSIVHECRVAWIKQNRIGLTFTGSK